MLVFIEQLSFVPLSLTAATAVLWDEGNDKNDT